MQPSKNAHEIRYVEGFGILPTTAHEYGVTLDARANALAAMRYLAARHGPPAWIAEWRQPSGAYSTR